MLNLNPVHIQSMAKTFKDAIEAFNGNDGKNRDWNRLEQLLDPDVVLITIKDNVSVRGNKGRGRKAVIDFLKEHVATDIEQFILDPRFPPLFGTNSVKGIALWKDMDEPGVVTMKPIHFFFRFSNNNTLIDRMWASPD